MAHIYFITWTAVRTDTKELTTLRSILISGRRDPSILNGREIKGTGVTPTGTITNVVHHKESIENNLLALYDYADNLILIVRILEDRTMSIIADEGQVLSGIRMNLPDKVKAGDYSVILYSLV